MMVLVLIGISLMLLGATGISFRRGGRHLLFFGGLLAFFLGAMVLYLAYLTTTDDFGR